MEDFEKKEDESGNIILSRVDSEPKEPQSWSPHWRATIGPLIESGDGILSKHLFKNKHLIEIFEVYHKPGELRIMIDLRDGSIFFNTQLRYRPSFPPDTKYRLIWYRRLSKEMFTLDKSTAAFDCLYYGIGWETEIDGRKINCGYVLNGDGKITEGLPESAKS